MGLTHFLVMIRMIYTSSHGLELQLLRDRTSPMSNDEVDIKTNLELLDKIWCPLSRVACRIVPSKES